MFTSRRQLIRASAATLAFSGFSRFAMAQEARPDAETYRSEISGYGPLRRDPAGVFDLPEGFSYTVVSRAGDPMSDGLVTPGKMDGMGCFALSNDRVALVRNHEINPRNLEITAFGPGRSLGGKIAADRIYDRSLNGLPLGGGTTTLVYDLRHKRLERDHLSLAGTSINCAGGVTPWGSWLSCEETTQGPSEDNQKDHGWVFEVPSRTKGLADPTPIKAMGRFRHEAAAIDPRTGVVYMTEDVGDGRGLFYRYLPNDRSRLLAGGKLQALALPEGEAGDPRNWGTSYWAPGDSRAVRWIDLDGVENPDEDLRLRGHAKGAAWFARGEGIFYGQGEIYFTCTSGGPTKDGQIMRYVPSAREGQTDEASAPGRLDLFVQPTDPSVMRMADNIAIAPWGHIFACEDKVGGINFLRAVTPQGKIYTVGCNAAPSGGDMAANAELAGICFSPDGTTMFINIYAPGVTLAVTGPWASFKA